MGGGGGAYSFAMAAYTAKIDFALPRKRAVSRYCDERSELYSLPD